MCALCMLKVNGIVGGYSIVRSVVGCSCGIRNGWGKSLNLTLSLSYLIVIFD